MKAGKYFGVHKILNIFYPFRDIHVLNVTVNRNAFCSLIAPCLSLSGCVVSCNNCWRNLERSLVLPLVLVFIWYRDRHLTDGHPALY